MRSHCFSSFVSSLLRVSEDKEKDILLRINSCPRAGYHDPVARRIRRKLILRQVHACCRFRRKRGGVENKHSLFRLVRRDTNKRTREEWPRRNLGASNAHSFRALPPPPPPKISSRQFFSCPSVHVCCCVQFIERREEWVRAVCRNVKRGRE